MEAVHQGLADVQAGRFLSDEDLGKRRGVYEKARHKHPERWSGPTRNWERVEAVSLNPDAETKHMDEAHAAAA